MLMGVARNLFGLSKPNAMRTTVLRAVATVIAVHGVWSAFELGLGTKLSMQTSLDWWNFEESVAGFFIHCAAVAGLAISVTYYGLKLLQRRAYTAHADHAATEPPTFVVVGEQDGISPPSAMRRRVSALRGAGTEVAYREYPRVGHGFGLGIGTTAEGWIGEAIAFWRRHQSPR